MSDYESLSAADRVTLVHLDLMRDAVYAKLGAVTQVGAVRIVEDFPTAMTDGRNVHYNGAWVQRMSREQLRFVVVHENCHKMFGHCTAFRSIVKQYPSLSAQAMDHSINLLIEEMNVEAGGKFVARPTDFPPLVDAKYAGMSWLDILDSMLRDGQTEPPPGTGSVWDIHMPGEESQESEAALAQEIQDAIVQGEITANALARAAGKGGGGRSLTGMSQGVVDWRGALRRFVQDACEGDDLSRWNPPNRRMLAHDIIMPGHYSEAVGELVIACDTSGSMEPLYKQLFGEVAHLCKQVKPSKTHIVWWSDKVERHQVFDREFRAEELQPKGGGGTCLTAATQYLREKKIKPQATIIATDGFLEQDYELPDGPILWAVFGNTAFVPRKGRALHIRHIDLEN